MTPPGVRLAPLTNKTNIGQRAGDPVTSVQDTLTAVAPVILYPGPSGMWELSWGEGENVGLFLVWHCHTTRCVTLRGLSNFQ